METIGKTRSAARHGEPLAGQPKSDAGRGSRSIGFEEEGGFRI